jgi:hypothetical protein
LLSELSAEKTNMLLNWTEIKQIEQNMRMRLCLDKK